MPGAVGRGVARLPATSLRVAAIGFVGALVMGAVVAACLRLLPSPFSALVGMMATLFFLISHVFGRVVLYAATGRWLQRRYPFMGRNSEALALLIGTTTWAILSSLPYVWPFVAALTIVLSFGLALTAGRRNGWKRPPNPEITPQKTSRNPPRLHPKRVESRSCARAYKRAGAAN